jgi:hypothetical protein
MYVLDPVMNRLSQRIEAVTNGFPDPAQVYAFGIRNVIIAATTDERWRWVLRRSEEIAEAMYRAMGPYAIRDIRNAVAAGRYCVENPELAWRQASHAITGKNGRGRGQFARHGGCSPWRGVGNCAPALPGASGRVAIITLWEVLELAFLRSPRLRLA